MKKLRKISLENFDKLSVSEASHLIGGDKNPTIPPPKTTKPPTTTKPVISMSVNPGGNGGTIHYSGDDWNAHLGLKPGQIEAGVGFPIW